MISFLLRLLSVKKLLGYVIAFGVLDALWGLFTNQPGNVIFGLILVICGFYCIRKVNKAAPEIGE